MKKTLIALAVLAVSGAAFAQSSVTISGNLDFAASSTSGTQANVKGTTVATTTGTASTSVLRFIAVEDLGGGMRATAQYNFDPRPVANDAGALTRDEMFVGLSGGFGNIRLGSPNSIGLNVFQVASPLGTGIGSGYAVATQDHVNTRYNRSARWDSAVMNGFQVSALYAPGNDQPIAFAASPATPPAQGIANARAVTELGLRYSKGPLTVAFANVAQAAQTTGTPANLTAATLPINVAKTSSNSLSASYVMGATTLMAGMNDGDALFNRTATASTALKSKGSRFGVAHTMGAVTLLASYASQETDKIKENITGLRADYALSKRTVAYVGYENWDNTKATTAIANTLTMSAAPAANGGDRKITSIGLRHSF